MSIYEQMMQTIYSRRNGRLSSPGNHSGEQESIENNALLLNEEEKICKTIDGRKLKDALCAVFLSEQSL